MSITKKFKKNENLLLNILKERNSITETAKEFCRCLNIEYSDSYRRALSKFLYKRKTYPQDGANSFEEVSKAEFDIEVPKGARIRSAWGKPGSMQFSYKFEEEENVKDTFREDLIKDLKKFSPKSEIPFPSTTVKGDCLLEICMPDFHMGRQGIKESRDLFTEVFWSLLSRARAVYDIGKIELPIGNDYLNTDGIDYTTTKGTKQFDYQKWYESFRAGWQLLATNISTASALIPINVRTILGNHDKCHDEATELLTSNGWISYRNITEDTLIATLDPKSKETVYQKPTDIFTMSYEGTMHRYKNRYTDCLVSPNHRMMVRRPQADQYSFVKSKDFKSTGYDFFRISGENYREDFEINDDWLRLFAWINSDGSIDKRGNVLIYQAEGSKEKRIRDLLKRLDINHHSYFRERTVKAVAGRDLIKSTNKHWVFTLNKKHSKKALEFIHLHLNDKYEIPEILHNCSTRQIDVYINEYILGDGTRKEEDSSFAIYGIKSVLDQLQHILVTNGYYAKVKQVPRDGSYVLYSHKKETMHAPEKSIEEYKGIIWCVEVPNSNFFTRRNGKLSIHGNSRMFYMGDVISAYFFNSERVEVFNEVGTFHKFVFGNNMVMYDHGEVKPQDYPLIMATEYPEDFSKTKFREVHTGHLHKEMINEYRGIKVRFLPSLAKESDWEKLQYKHIRQAQALVWHKEHGLIDILQYNVNT